MDKKYEVVEITFINELGERITYNLETGVLTPENLSDDSKENAVLRTGGFIENGNAGLKKLWGQS